MNIYDERGKQTKKENKQNGVERVCELSLKCPPADNLKLIKAQFQNLRLSAHAKDILFSTLYRLENARLGGEINCSASIWHIFISNDRQMVKWVSERSEMRDYVVITKS